MSSGRSNAGKSGKSSGARRGSRPTGATTPQRTTPGGTGNQRRGQGRRAPQNTEEGVGERLTLEVGKPAHGGFCVARHEGRVVFVRHAAPGEKVIAQVTEGGAKKSLWRADCVEVLDASADRIAHPWPAAAGGGVGGAELGHLTLAAARRWKTAVVGEQLARLAGITWDGQVRGIAEDERRGGLRWRTRVGLVTDSQGRLGMHPQRSTKVIALDEMPLATDSVNALIPWGQGLPANVSVQVAAPGSGGPGVLLVDGLSWGPGMPDARPGHRMEIPESVGTLVGRFAMKVRADGFWQVHLAAPTELSNAVLRCLGVEPDGSSQSLQGAVVWDLYCGAGLFSRSLAEAVGGAGRVVAVEADVHAVADAQANLAGCPQVEVRRGVVGQALAGLSAEVAENGLLRPDVVVLDPPRAGVGRAIVQQLADVAPERVVYVACDPACLARDIGFFAEAGYCLESLDAVDIFPLTHHVECVALLVRDGVH